MARSGLVTRAIGTVIRPRAAMAAATEASAGDILGTWALVLAVWLSTGGVLWSTAVGRQALVDERVRVVEALGGAVDEAGYRTLQARPPVLTYFTSGGRTLLLPPVTAAVAAGLFAWLRRVRRSPRVTYRACLGIAVQASVVLALQQVLAAPLHLLRESLTSPFNLATLVPWFDDGSLAARFLGTVEAFGVWWVALLALGCAAVSGRQARTCLAPLLGMYVLVAGAVAAAVVLSGGL